MVAPNKSILIRREILERIAKQIFDETLLLEIDKIPLNMRPRGTQSFRCCIYRDRALIKYKIMAMMGYVCKSEEDEMTPLSDFVLQSYIKAPSEKEILRVVEDACHGCQQNSYVVTNMCRGCDGRPCEVNCPKDAIDFVGQRAVINQDKCISCGICEKSCPYHSIIYAPVPCEEACPVGAISKNENGKEVIDFDKCTYCGKCMSACPFGAIVEESHLFDLIFSLKKKKNIVAMLAPSVAAQFGVQLSQMKKALLAIGFADVIYVAEGAELTAKEEAAEFLENEEPIMTTSCCPSFVNIIEKHVPELKDHISHTPSPMVFTSKIVAEKHPGALRVFIGPCLAKKAEAYRVGGIDMVINFEELDAMLNASEQLPENFEADDKENLTSFESWNFAQSGGVLAAVEKHLPEGHSMKPFVYNGIDRKALKTLKVEKKIGKHNFLEGMSCENGCIGGCYMSVKPVIANKRLQKLK